MIEKDDFLKLVDECGMVVLKNTKSFALHSISTFCVVCSLAAFSWVLRRLFQAETGFDDALKLLGHYIDAAKSVMYLYGSSLLMLALFVLLREDLSKWLRKYVAYKSIDLAAHMFSLVCGLAVFYFFEVISFGNFFLLLWLIAMFWLMYVVAGVVQWFFEEPILSRMTWVRPVTSIIFSLFIFYASYWDLVLSYKAPINH